MPAQPSLRRFFGNQGGGAAAMPTESVRWLSEARMFIHPNADGVAPATESRLDDG